MDDNNEIEGNSLSVGLGGHTESTSHIQMCTLYFTGQKHIRDNELPKKMDHRKYNYEQ